MATVFHNATLIEFDPPSISNDELRIDGERIVECSPSVSRVPNDEIIDCRGAVILPGLVNGHTHLYSALATGMPPPPQTPSNFLEILKFVWWRLDQALDLESIVMSARIGSLQALRCGTTTLIDHHASPNAIEGSLDRVKAGIADVGLRGVLCYETTDRHGPSGREAGLAENVRFAENSRIVAPASEDDGVQLCVQPTFVRPRRLKPAAHQHFKTVHGHQNDTDHQFAGLIGAHALFTLEDDTLHKLHDLAEQFGTGIHIHVAEDPCDETEAQQRYKAQLVDRLADFGLLNPNSIFAHGTHLSPAAVERINEVGLTIVHCARSNMNNAVGYAPLLTLKCPVIMGTDGIGGDLFAEAKAAWYISRHEHSSRTPDDVITSLAASARRASESLGITLGQLRPGAAADVVLTDYIPYTPLDSDNIASHFIFAMSAQQVRSVMVRGEWVLRDGIVQSCDEQEIHKESLPIATHLWKRMESIPC